MDAAGTARAPAPERLLEAHGLSREFALPGGESLTAVDAIDLTLESGVILGILGPNGAGKTTLLRMLAGLIPPTSGALRIAGLNLTGHLPEIRRAVGFLSGNTRLYGRLTPREHLLLFARLFEIPRAQRSARIAALLSRLGIEAIAGRRVETLSTGQAQRVSIARALLHNPRILILDEPTSGLDLVGVSDVLELLTEFREGGGAVVLSTHQLTEAEQICGRMALMDQGRFLISGDLPALRKRSPTGLLRDLFLQLSSGKARS